MKRLFAYGALLASVLVSGTAHAETSHIVVNGVPLSDQQIIALQSIYGVPLVPGRYWYDPVSGLWGLEGGPSLNQILPGLPLGGPLKADASFAGTHTDVFFNGREIHPTEYLALQQRFGYVQPGRYWLNAQGIGGPEGGPAMFSLATTSSRGGGAGGSGFSPDDVNAPCVYVDNPDGSFVSMPGC